MTWSKQSTRQEKKSVPIYKAWEETKWVPSMQIGQFIGTRADFVPEPICKKLALLQDKVPPH